MLIPWLRKRGWRVVGGGGGGFKTFCVAWHQPRCRQKKRKKIRGTSKPSNPRLLCERLVCASASWLSVSSWRRLNGTDAFTQANHLETKEQLWPPWNIRRISRKHLAAMRVRGGSWCFGWAPSQKREQPDALPQFCIFSLLGLTCLAWKCDFRENPSPIC